MCYILIKYSEDDIMNMLKFLKDNIFVFREKPNFINFMTLIPSLVLNELRLITKKAFPPCVACQQETLIRPDTWFCPF